MEIHRCLPPGRQHFLFTVSSSNSSEESTMLLHVTSPQLPLESVSTIARFKDVKTMLRDSMNRVKAHYVDVKERAPFAPLRLFHTTIRCPVIVAEIDRNRSSSSSSGSPFFGTWKYLRRTSITLNFHDILLKRMKSFVAVQRKVYSSQLQLCFNDILWTMKMKDVTSLMEEASRVWGDGDGKWFEANRAYEFLSQVVNDSFSQQKQQERLEKMSTEEERIKLCQGEFSLRRKYSQNRSYYDTENSICERAFMRDWMMMKVNRLVKDERHLPEMFKLMFVHFRDLYKMLQFWSSRCFMLNRIDLSTTLEFFQDMDCVVEEEIIEEEQDDDDDEEDDDEDVNASSIRRRGTKVNRKRRKAHPKCTKRDIESAFKKASSIELSVHEDSRYLIRSQFLLCIILVSRVLYHLPSQSRERKFRNARHAGKGVVVIYHSDMFNCLNEFLSHYVEPFIGKTKMECLSSISMDLEPDTFRRDSLYFSSLPFFLEQYEDETKKLFDTYVVIGVQGGGVVSPHHLSPLLHVL